MTIDLRSDTATRPTPRMRHAMAEAEVGDDGFGEDPTVNLLQELSAEAVGKEAAVFVASGTMANQLAMMVLARPGHRIICGQGAHIATKEVGASALLGGLSFTEVATTTGEFTAEEILGARTDGGQSVDLVAVENTHQSCGGYPWRPEALADLRTGADAAELPIYMDGARLFNAAVAAGVPARAYTDSVNALMFCLSKSLGAPVGSVVCGSASFVAEVRERKLQLGGGWRQAGVLAAAGIVALEEAPGRLHEDHATARQLAEGMAAISPGVTDPDRVRTNIVFVDPSPLGISPGETAARLKEAGILCKAGQTRMRLVTHRDIGQVHIEQCLTAWSAIVKECSPVPA
jgi:threonine aldolase